MVRLGPAYQRKAYVRMNGNPVKQYAKDDIVFRARDEPTEATKYYFERHWRFRKRPAMKYEFRWRH